MNGDNVTLGEGPRLPEILNDLLVFHIGVVLFHVSSISDYYRVQSRRGTALEICAPAGISLSSVM